MLKTFTLKNGLKVASYSMPLMRSAFLTISVKGGAIFDTKEKSGVAHYMEHILVQGTPSYPNVEALSDYIEKLAGSYNATTYTQHIRFNINAPTNYLSEMVKIAGEVFFLPLFTEDSIERERNAVLEEIRQRQDALWYKNHQFFSDVRFNKNHPMLLDPGGSLESVSNLQKNDLVSYWQEFFDPANAYVVAVGGFSQDEIVKSCEKYLGHFESKKEFKGYQNLTDKDMSARTVAIREDKTLQACYIDLSYPSMSDNVSLKDRVVQGIARSILGGLSSSRLNRLLRQRRGLVYYVSFGFASYETFGYGVVTSQVVRENLDQVLELIIKELQGFIAHGPTEEELQFAKNYSSNRALMQFDHPAAIASWIEGDLIWEDEIMMPEEYEKVINSITKKDVMEMMGKYWKLEQINLTIQGPIESSKENVEKYSQLLDVLVPGT
jgi:predicted Zn-dependent peptidase